MENSSDERVPSEGPEETAKEEPKVEEEPEEDLFGVNKSLYRFRSRGDIPVKTYPCHNQAD
jgi:hypothetical protein